MYRFLIWVCCNRSSLMQYVLVYIFVPILSFLSSAQFLGGETIEMMLPNAVLIPTQFFCPPMIGANFC